MNEQDLRERLLASAVVAPPTPSKVNEDLMRGRQRRHRRNLTIAGTSLAVVAVLGATAVAVGLAASPNSADRLRQGGFAHGGKANPTPSHQAASTTGRILTAAEAFGASHYTEGGPDELEAWKEGWYSIAYAHLDPDHRYIPDPHSVYNGRSGVGIGAQDDEYRYYIGMTLNWSVGDPSQDRVSIDVAPASADGVITCGELSPCHSVDDPTYGEFQLGGDPDGTGGFEVVLTRPDGVFARVVVSPFGRGPDNDASQAPLPSLDQVLALATDPALGLPTK